MDRVATLPAQDRRALFQEVAARRGLTALVIEKDFWVCWTLRRVFALPGLGEHLIFKGGTSLSKVFGLIERFSEDIDLSIRRDYLGAVGDKDPEQEGVSNNQRARRVEALRENCRRTVREEMLPALQASFAARLGAAAGDPGWTLEPDPSEMGTLLFTYPSPQKLTAGSVYIRPQIKLEMGSGSDPFPVGRHPVRSYAAETFPEAFGDPEVTVTALEAERTFWEKATLLHAECHRPLGKPTPARLSRHLYDLSRHLYDLMRLSLSPIGEKALLDQTLRERVVLHKSTYFASNWANYGTARPGTFRLVPSGERVSELRQDYTRMRDMIFAHVPTFEEILGTIQTLEGRINEGP